MKKIVLDGKLTDTREKLFLALKEQMQSQVFTGNNLDAFYDALTEYPEEIELEILNGEDLKQNLGVYAERFIRVYYEYRRELE